jgi:hypothetical protein
LSWRCSYRKALEIEPLIKPKRTMEVTTKIPIEKEIQSLEHKLEQLKSQRDEAKRAILAAVKSEEILGSLDREELSGLMKRIQQKLTGQHKKRRGSPVGEELKKDLIAAIREDHYSLSQLERMFNLSVSYISRVKKELREEGKLRGPILNAYEDHQLNHQQAPNGNHHVHA